MKKLIIISDWADDRLARQEFRSAVEGFLKDPLSPNITYVSTTPSTIHTSFVTAQIVEVEERLGRPHETIIFQNTDPRLPTDENARQGKGAEFVVIRLLSGIFICGPNAKYDFSLIKDKIEKIYLYHGLSNEGQFRSRDRYSRVSAHLMDQLEDELELDEVSKDIIPEVPGYHIGHIDSYGNLKTTIRKSDFKGRYEYGDLVKIRLNKIEKKALYVQGLFNGEIGELVIYPGSSGPINDPYLEISSWEQFQKDVEWTTGVFEFNNPKPGMKVDITD